MKDIEKMKETKNMEEGIKKVIMQLPDGSVFSVEDKYKLSALKMKLEVDELSIDEFISIFIKKVEKHWNERTVPTKFPWNISWEKDLKDEIWHRLYNKLYCWGEKEVKKTFGKPVASLTPARWFDEKVKEENAKLIRDGVAIKGNKLILRSDTREARIYWEISDRFSALLEKETKKEFAKGKEEAKNRFKNQAELAEEVFYQYIRPYLIGIILSKATKGKAGSIVTSEDDSSASISFVKEDSLIHRKFKKQEKEKERN